MTIVTDALQASLADLGLPRGRRPLALVMLSGGLDSSVLLDALLGATGWDVHAHHIELDNRHGRLAAEQRAVDAVLAYCREHHRPFEHSTSGHRFDVDGRMGGGDAELCLFTAARVCHALVGRVDAVITGHINRPFADHAHAEAVFHACFLRARRRPPWLRPFTRLRGTFAEKKRAIWESVPVELASRTWWCRRPVADGEGWRRCGNCPACEVMDLALVHRGVE